MQLGKYFIEEIQKMDEVLIRQGNRRTYFQISEGGREMVVHMMTARSCERKCWTSEMNRERAL